MTEKWQSATLVKNTQISRDIHTLFFRVKRQKPHIAGQFYILKIRHNNRDISREYSIANVPSDKSLLEFGIQKIPNGIVSNVLCDLEIGAKIFLKGPVGIYFNWNEKYLGSIVLISGGAGIVPYMSMIRMRTRNRVTLISSFKTIADFAYKNELENEMLINKKFSFTTTLTRDTSNIWNGRKGRINNDYLQSIILNKQSEIQFFVCGRSEFVEDMYKILISLQVPNENIQRERFG